jgi:dihydroflavonol-4-reductase
MRVLVTGANGHIGCNLLPILLEEGHDVVPFVRTSSDTSGIDELGLEYARGDVMDGPALEAAAEGCEAIIHMAAVYTLANDPEAVMKPALEGAKNVIAAAKKHGIGRIVYTSSVVSVGSSSEPKVRTEEDWAEDATLPYAIAKRDSERIATRLADEAGLEIVILNPGMVLGPGDVKITPSTQSLINWLTGKSQTVRGGMALVDVRDVALAHARALTKGEHRERHILAAGNVEFKELGKRLKKLFGMGPIHLRSPRGVIVPMAGMIEKLHLMLDKESPVSRLQAEEYAGRWAWYDGSKASRVFGLEYRDLDQTLRDAVADLVERGAFPPRVEERLRRRQGAA